MLVRKLPHQTPCLVSPRTWAGHVRHGDSVSPGHGKALFPYSSQSRGRAVLIGDWSAAISSPWKTSIPEGRLLGTQEVSSTLLARSLKFTRRTRLLPPRGYTRGWAAAEAEFRLRSHRQSRAGLGQSVVESSCLQRPGAATCLGLTFSDAAAFEFSMLL